MATVSAPLRFRRQYVLGDAPPPGLDGWPRLSVGGLVLAHHPDAEVAVYSGAAVAALVGSPIDPGRPEQSPADLARDLAEAAGPEAALDTVDRWSGPFVAIRADGETAEVHHDPCGLREVCYTTDGPLWVGAGAALLAEVGGLGRDPEADAFERSAGYKGALDLWPGTRTPVAGVRRLLANHVLHLPSRRATRTFPRHPLVERTVDEGAGALIASLRGSIRAAVARGPVRLALTGGWDSRMLLAAARPLIEQIGLYFVVHPRPTPWGEHDLAMARRLAAIAGRPLDEIHYEDAATDGFRRALAESVSHGRLRPALLEHAFLGRPPTIHGMCSEVARKAYPRRPRPTPGRLARLRAGTAHPLVAAEYGEWLAEAEPVARRLGYSTMDLFYWEQFVGVWAARDWTEMRVASPAVAPFDHRPLLQTLLGVPERFRGREHNPLYRAAYEQAWPELLEVPLNPRFQNRVIRWMERARVYGLYGQARLLGKEVADGARRWSTSAG